MKKLNGRKLTLHKETITRLDNGRLKGAVGGGWTDMCETVWGSACGGDNQTDSCGMDC